MAVFLARASKPGILQNCLARGSCLKLLGENLRQGFLFWGSAWSGTESEWALHAMQLRGINKQSARASVALAICACLAPLVLCAQEPSQTDLRKLARNPFADVIKLPLVPDIYFDTGPYHRTAGDVQIQPLIPFQISKKWLLVPRLVATAVNYGPPSTQVGSGKLGTGDTVFTLFFTPAHVGRLIWGVGPALLIPTATDIVLGAGKWGLGPSFVVLSQPKWGSTGILLQNVWSLPGSIKRGPVDQMQLQPMFSYNLAHDWYLTTSPTIAADWTQVFGQRWLVPIGGGAGRTFKLGRQPVDANLTLYRNVIRPEYQAKWQLSVQITLLITKHR